MVVSGASMRPTIHAGDRVIVSPTDPAQLEPGDIVMIDGVQPRIHRVIRVHRSAGIVVTRGDSLAGEDPPASFGDVVGRVVVAERSLARRSRLLLGRCKQFVARVLKRP